MSGADVVLEAAEVAKTFREGSETVCVLSGASLAVRRGEVVTLEGPSGSGKSTLLCILGCLLTPTSGTVLVDGHVVSAGADLARIRRERIGFVFQQFNLVPALTALDNVALALRLRGLGRDSARRAAFRALDVVGLSSRAAFLPRDLSGGQKQRVAIARALVGAPPIVLADEPTANLDAGSSESLLALFASTARRASSALLIVTHDPKVRTIADRTVVLENGRCHERVVSRESPRTGVGIGA